MDQQGTQQVNRQVSEEFLTEKLPVGWPWKILVSGVFLFSLTVFIYIALQFGYSAYLSAEEKKVDTLTTQLEKQVTAEDRTSFVNFYSQVVNLKQVLSQHLFSYNVFSFLEKSTLPTITYTSAAMDNDAHSLTVEGVANAFDAVAGQVAVFEEQPEVLLASLEKVTLTGAHAVFSIKVTFLDSFFEKPGF